MEVKDGYILLNLPPESSKELVLGREVLKKTCEVCGHLNEKQALMCKMCSNYLKKGEN